MTTEFQYVVLQYPSALAVTEGATTDPVSGRIFHDGLTQPAGPAALIVAELGYGDLGSDPTTDGSSWTWTTAIYNTQVGNDDEYQANFSGLSAGTYAYTFRFSDDGGINWTYADIDGNGVNPGLDFSSANLGTLTVNEVNAAPTAISLSASGFAENQPLNSTVATLTATDPNLANGTFAGPFTFTLVSGAGDIDNAAFTIVGVELKKLASADFETKSSYSVRLHVTDNGGLSFETTQIINVLNVSTEIIKGTSVANSLSGGAEIDKIFGYAGNDTLLGFGNDDILTGGAGRDVMTGGSGADDFDYNSYTETGKTSSTRDIIRDFHHLVDDIDLRTIDANGSASGDAAFKFLATKGAAFTGVKGQLHWYQYNSSTNSADKTIIEGDINGDKVADFQIQLTGLKTLTSSDFLL